ncbi:Uu.00g037600.m01.CDS01 [Anthostomella pinea]|uniref:Uu.00g037600.m01.CDS01 n=1 Tax=Anthostomella pinea TaxID=933095 RepID=A0AAI8VAA4_9PEZI|nr:Uu.00g037600.m01.CDS01 [Anthostomella pinea]
MVPVKDIADIGSTPYSVVRPLLLKIDSAAHLRQLEIASPHLEGDDAECWKRLIDRNFPTLSRKMNYKPSNPTSWYKIYAKYQRMEADMKREAEEKLKSAFKTINKEKAENVSTLVDYDRRKLPRTPQDLKGQAGARSKANGRRGGPNDTSGLRFTGGSRTKLTTGKSIIQKARREAKEITARNRLNTPGGELASRSSQMMKAPPGRVQEMINKSRPAGGVRPPAPRPHHETMSRELQEREARLRKMKKANDKDDKANVIDDDELEGEADLGGDDELDGGAVGGGLSVDDLEGLFDDDGEEEEKPKSSPPARNSSMKTGILSRKLPSSLAAPPAARRVVPASPAKPAAQPSSSARPVAPSMSPPQPLGPSSPPAGSPPSSSAEANPRPPMPRKRKPVDIFMRPRPKVQRRQ